MVFVSLLILKCRPLAIQSVGDTLVIGESFSDEPLQHRKLLWTTILKHESAFKTNFHYQNSDCSPLHEPKQDLSQSFVSL